MSHPGAAREPIRSPLKDSAKKSAKLIKGAVEIYYPAAARPHRHHADLVNRDARVLTSNASEGRVTTRPAVWAHV